MAGVLRLKATLEEKISLALLDSSFGAFYGIRTVFSKVNKTKVWSAFVQGGTILTGER